MSNRSKRSLSPAPPGALFATPPCYSGAYFSQRIHLFDSNILNKLGTTPDAGQGLGRLLQTLRDPDEPKEAVVLLPAVAEANYRKTEGAANVLRRYQGYFEPNFGTHGIREVGAFSLGNREQTLAQNLFELSFRLIVNYWLLCTARMALDGRKKKADRGAALRYFFDAVKADDCLPKSRFPFLAVATAVAGNIPANNALNLKDTSVEALMNGSWDLLHWHGFVQLSLDAERTGCVPQFYSYDSDAVGLFLRIERQDDDSFQFVYGGDAPEDPLQDVIAEGVNNVKQANVAGDQVIARIHNVLPIRFHCREYQYARELFKDSLAMCLAEAPPGSLFVLKRPVLR